MAQFHFLGSHPRVESMQPRDFSSEPSSSTPGPKSSYKDEEEDLLDLECYPSYARRSESWEVLGLAFQNLDRQTGTTTILVASLVTWSKLHMIRYRSIKRTPVYSSS
ncbi:hypothetical protein M378DRAFT_639877 [Amanita muscaria Koide BX008]|uniref:Uncharacterized protein n=1 Tax=Amanita muscaria (strain Koide BX008) TaxID=946122 RepID=A0A0C2RY94_AMAMK|nr:hypothetical protein M378DRAFT_639877 [Amanita muscaria Koide BX008]